jgi:hypothetical protein
VKNKRFKAIAAGVAVVAAITAAGVAYAAFARTNDADAVGTSEKFRPLTVSGTWASGGLLPGESGNVTITVSVSGDNTVGARVTSIVARPITADAISGIADAGKKQACADMLKAAEYTPTTLILAKGATNVKLALKSAVAFSSEAPVDCEGMQFATKWTVSFAPDRAATGLTGSGATVDVQPGGANPNPGQPTGTPPGNPNNK